MYAHTHTHTHLCEYACVSVSVSVSISDYATQMPKAWLILLKIATENSN